MRTRLQLPEVVDPRLEREVAFLRTATSALRPGVPIPEGLHIQCENPRDENSPFVQEVRCPTCRGVRHVPLRDKRGTRLVVCGVCGGTGQARGILRAVVVEAIDGEMPKTNELVRLFASPPGPDGRPTPDSVAFLPSLLLRRTGSIVARNGLATVWTDINGGPLPGYRHAMLGPVLQSGVACGVKLHKHGETGEGHVEAVGALEGKVVREFLGGFTWEDKVGGKARDGSFPEYASARAKAVVEAWGVDLEAVILTALKIGETERGGE
jgi:hypothetical protein